MHSSPATAHSQPRSSHGPLVPGTDPGSRLGIGTCPPPEPALPGAGRPLRAAGPRAGRGEGGGLLPAARPAAETRSGSGRGSPRRLPAGRPRGRSWRAAGRAGHAPAPVQHFATFFLFGGGRVFARKRVCSPCTRTRGARLSLVLPPNFAPSSDLLHRGAQLEYGQHRLQPSYKARGAEPRATQNAACQMSTGGVHFF